MFRDHLVLEERRDGLIRLRVRPWRDGEPAASSAAEHEIEFDEPAYTAGIGDNPEVDAKSLRFYYSSMTTPGSVYDYDLETRERSLRKRDTILGGFDPSHYATERLWATARDGVRVPISLVYRKDQRRPGGNPLLLYGYGSYGISSDAGFDPDRVTLLDRGFVYAIAHIRGGQELGRAWYEDGKLQHKMNTFTDFIDCAEHLVQSGWADRSRLFAMGGSAGGLLMGAVVNLRPDLFRGVVARVPFVDVVTTMLDDSIPLTTSEFDEWGDPERPEDYEYMLVVLAVRQRQGGRLPESAGDRRPPRLAGAVLRAGEVGGQAARHQDRRRPRAAGHADGGGTRRPVGALSPAQRDRADLRVPDRSRARWLSERCPARRQRTAVSSDPLHRSRRSRARMMRRGSVSSPGARRTKGDGDACSVLLGLLAPFWSFRAAGRRRRGGSRRRFARGRRALHRRAGRARSRRLRQALRALPWRPVAGQPGAAAHRRRSSICRGAIRSSRSTTSCS